MKIIKRDGRKVPFDQNKIIDAVLAAFRQVDGDVSDYAYIKAGNIADYILEYCKEYKKTKYAEWEEEKKENPNAELPQLYLNVEDIQDLVQKGLMSTKRKDVAEAYICYRHDRTLEREKKSALIQEVGKHLMARNVQNQNANVDEYSFGGRKGEAANALMKEYALKYIMSTLARENHLNNLIYTHDLDSYAVGMHNCLSIPIDPLAKHGFNTRQIDIRPCRSFNSFGQISAVCMQLQSLQQFGGVAYTHYDWSGVPYVRISFWKYFKEALEFLEDEAAFSLYFPDDVDLATIPIEPYSWHSDSYEYANTDDTYLPMLSTAKSSKAYRYAMKKIKKEIHQTIEALYHNLNTLQSRSGNQLPFSSINYGTCTLPEGRMITKAILEVSIEGLGKLHRTSIFPCGIFQCMKGVNRKPGDPNYDLYRLALESTSKRLYPNYANVDWSGNAGYDINDPRTYFSTMGLVA